MSCLAGDKAPCTASVKFEVIIVGSERNQSDWRNSRYNDEGSFVPPTAECHGFNQKWGPIHACTYSFLSLS